MNDGNVVTPSLFEKECLVVFTVVKSPMVVLAIPNVLRLLRLPPILVEWGSNVLWIVLTTYFVTSTRDVFVGILPLLFVIFLQIAYHIIKAHTHGPNKGVDGGVVGGSNHAVIQNVAGGGVGLDEVNKREPEAKEVNTNAQSGSSIQSGGSVPFSSSIRKRDVIGKSYSETNNVTPTTGSRKQLMKKVDIESKNNLENRPDNPGDNPADNEATAPDSGGKMERKVVTQRLIALDYLRASLLLMILLAIWGVDFPFFPKANMKTSFYSIGLMDIGTGGIIFASGATVARPSAMHAPFPWLTVIACSLLGLSRTLVFRLKKLNYAISEYGRDWNFYFTIAATITLSWLLRNLATASRNRNHDNTQTSVSRSWRDPRLLIGRFGSSLIVYAMFLSALQELLLSIPLPERPDYRYPWRVRDYVLQSRDTSERIGTLNLRSNIFSANLEGLISLPGYVSLALVASHLSAVLFDPAKSNLQKVYCMLRRSLIGIVIYTAFTRYTLWREKPPHEHILSGHPRAFPGPFLLLPSQRLCNAAYVLYVTLLMETNLYLLILATQARIFWTPRLIERMSRHLLSIFLVANVIMGVINWVIGKNNLPGNCFQGRALISIFGIASVHSPAFFSLFRRPWERLATTIRSCFMRVN